jgi:uncharacterized protein YcsI (UPF0317 family)
MAAPHTLNAHSTPKAVREAARHGLLTGPTSGLASGYVQVNLVILPEADGDRIGAVPAGSHVPARTA